MGVEYKHFLVPADASFIAAATVFAKVDAVLQKWELKKEPAKLYNLTGGINQPLHCDLAELEMGHGIAMEYAGIDGTATAAIMGPSYYGNDIKDEERYISNISFIAGTDFRIHPSSEELSLSVVTPPSENNLRLEPYCEMDEFLHYGLHAEAYHCTAAALPPEVEIWVADLARIIGTQSFFGYWRTALVIDCGKDLPGIGTDFYKLASTAFLQDIETAVGTTLIEIGEVY